MVLAPCLQAGRRHVALPPPSGGQGLDQDAPSLTCSHPCSLLLSPCLSLSFPSSSRCRSPPVFDDVWVLPLQIDAPQLLPHVVLYPLHRLALAGRLGVEQFVLARARPSATRRPHSRRKSDRGGRPQALAGCPGAQPRRPLPPRRANRAGTRPLMGIEIDLPATVASPPAATPAISASPAKRRPHHFVQG